MKKIKINVTIDCSVLKKTILLSALQNRTLSNMVETILKEHHDNVKDNVKRLLDEQKS